MFENLLKNKIGRIIISIIWGFGLAALFKRVCKERDCIIIKSLVSPQNIQNKIYEFENKCYQFEPKITKCN